MKEVYELKVKQAQEVKTKTKDGLNNYHVMLVGWGDVSVRFKQPNPFPFPVEGSLKITVESSQTKLVEPKKKKKKSD